MERAGASVGGTPRGRSSTCEWRDNCPTPQWLGTSIVNNLFPKTQTSASPGRANPHTYSAFVASPPQRMGGGKGRGKGLGKGWVSTAGSSLPTGTGGGGGWHEAVVLVCLPLAAPIGLSPLHILTLCGSERVLVVSMTCPV